MEMLIGLFAGRATKAPAKRLSTLLQTLWRGELHTAAGLGEDRELAERPVRRDIPDLRASGVPIDDVAGVGDQRLSRCHLQPPISAHESLLSPMFGAWSKPCEGGFGMASAARDDMTTIESSLPGSEYPREALDFVACSMPRFGSVVATRRMGQRPFIVRVPPRTMKRRPITRE